MSIQLSVKHHFSAGHRIPGLPGAGAKCSNLHGHTFGVTWTFEVQYLDASEFEFAEAKAGLRAWVDENFDHGFLVGPDDRALAAYLRAENYKHFILSYPPTTEAIADELLTLALSRRDKIGAPCVRVRVTEGPHNEAVVTP